MKGADNEESCNAEHQILSKLLNEIEYLNLDSSRLRKQINSMRNDADSIRNLKEELESRIDSVSEDLSRFKSLLQTMERDAFEGYQRYGQIYGASIGITFNSNWGQMLRQIEDLNRNSRITFTQLPISRSILNISATKSNPLNANLPVLSNASVPGFSIVDLTKGNGMPAKVLGIENNDTINPTPWVNAAAGNIDLTLLGACDLIEEDNALSMVKVDKAIGALIKINAIHTYPVTLQRSYEILFNSKRILEEMEKVTENNGFLSSEKIHEVVKNNVTQDMFDVHFYNDDVSNGFSADEQAAIKLDAKYEIVDKILAEIGAIAHMPSELPPVPRLDHSRGVRLIIAANTCYGYALCYVPGFVIGVVDAIWGDTEATAKFKRINNVNIRHRYSNESAAYHAISTTYKNRVY